MRVIFRPAALLAGVSLSVAAVAAPFDNWADKVANDKMRNNPQQATQKQYFSGAEQDQLDRKLTDNTRNFRAKEVAIAKSELAELA